MPMTTMRMNESSAVLVCSICLERIEGESKVSGMCPHVYHSDCLLEWAKRDNNDNCPTCRRPLWDAKLYKNLETDVLKRFGFDERMMRDPNEVRFLSDEDFSEPESIGDGAVLAEISTRVLLYIDAPFSFTSATAQCCFGWETLVVVLEGHSLQSATP